MDIPSIQSTTNIYGVAGTISATSMIEQVYLIGQFLPGAWTHHVKTRH